MNQPLKEYTIGNRTHTRSEWCKELGISQSEFYLRLRRFKNGETQVAGFLHKNTFRHHKHGESGGGISKLTTRLYRAWHHISDLGKQFMCDEWRNDFCAFRDWAKHNGYNEETGYVHFHRRDKNDLWCPANTEIRPIVGEHHIFLTYNGITMTVTDWARSIGVSKQTLFARVKKGMPVEKALTENIHLLDNQPIDIDND